MSLLSWSCDLSQWPSTGNLLFTELWKNKKRFKFLMLLCLSYLLPYPKYPVDEHIYEQGQTFTSSPVGSEWSRSRIKWSCSLFTPGHSPAASFSAEGRATTGYTLDSEHLTCKDNLVKTVRLAWVAQQDWWRPKITVLSQNSVCVCMCVIWALLPA